MAIPRSYSGNQFLFRLDDEAGAPALLRSVSGGGINGQIVDEGMGSDHRRIKHVGVVELEKIDVELSLALADPFIRWISESWTRTYSRRNGAVIHADFGYKEKVTQSFQEALITETKFPALDGSKGEPAYITVSIQPELSEIKKGDGSTISGVEKTGQKKWQTSNFRLEIDGVDCTHVNKIDGWSVKQSIKQVYNGQDRFPEIEPTGIEFDDLTIYMALDHADGFLEWHRQYVHKGEEEGKHEKTGAIVLLAPDCNEQLLTVNLANVGIRGFTIESSKAASGDIKRAKVDLYVEAMDLKRH